MIAKTTFTAQRMSDINWTVGNLLTKLEPYANAQVQQDIADVKHILQLLSHVGHCIHDDPTSLKNIERLFSQE